MQSGEQIPRNPSAEAMAAEFRKLQNPEMTEGKHQSLRRRWDHHDGSAMQPHPACSAIEPGFHQDLTAPWRAANALPGKKQRHPEFEAAVASRRVPGRRRHGSRAASHRLPWHSIKIYFGSQNFRIRLKAGLPQGIAQDHDIATTGPVLVGGERPPQRGRNTKNGKRFCTRSPTLNALYRVTRPECVALT